MELVGKVVRKEIDGFCSGTVQSYPPPSGYYKIVYVNDVTEISKLAEFAAALVMKEEGKSEETPVQVKYRKRSRKQPRKKIKRYKVKLQDEVNVMRNVDLNEEIPDDNLGLRGNLDLNRAVLEPDEGLG